MGWDARSGLPGGNARFLAGMYFESATKTRRLESRRCRLEARSTHPCVPVCSETGVTITFMSMSRTPLNQRQDPRSKHGTRHGSTRYLWKDDDVVGAVEYVIMRQGEPMAVLPVLESRFVAKTAP